MKKKITLSLLAIVCALCCAFGLVACGDGDAPKKRHTAAQWSAAFSDPSTTDSYDFQETCEGQQVRSLAYDKDSEYYYYSYGYKTVSGDEVTFNHRNETAYKTGGHYYAQTDGTADNKIYEITPEQFSEKVNDNEYISFVEKLLSYCKDHYNNFKPAGSGVVNNEISYNAYLVKNVRLEIDQTRSVLLEELVVDITNVGALYDISARFEGEDITKKDYATAKHACRYRNANADEYAILSRTAPSRLDGNTFKLVRIDDVNAEGAPSGNDPWIASVVAANSNKTITAKADGTLDGNIEIDMNNGATLALNTMKYTENFFNVGTYGEVTVSNAHIPELTEEQKVTLTGNLTDGSYSGDGYSNAFKLTLDQDGQVFDFYFAPIAN